MPDQFARDIAGALKQAIAAHGHIGYDDIGSATKRIAAAIRESAKRERGRMETTPPRQQPGVGLGASAPFGAQGTSARRLGLSL